MDYTFVRLAREIAETAHRGVADKGGMPFIGHPARVALGARPGSREARVVGYLHDVFEDTDIPMRVLEDLKFSIEVIDAVRVITRVKSNTYREYIELVVKNKLATLVKISDLRDNLDPIRLRAWEEHTGENLFNYVKSRGRALSELEKAVEKNGWV